MVRRKPVGEGSSSPLESDDTFSPAPYPPPSWAGPMSPYSPPSRPPPLIPTLGSPPPPMRSAPVPPDHDLLASPAPSLSHDYALEQDFHSFNPSHVFELPARNERIPSPAASDVASWNDDDDDDYQQEPQPDYSANYGDEMENPDWASQAVREDVIEASPETVHQTQSSTDVAQPLVPPPAPRAASPKAARVSATNEAVSPLDSEAAKQLQNLATSESLAVQELNPWKTEPGLSSQIVHPTPSTTHVFASSNPYAAMQSHKRTTSAISTPPHSRISSPGPGSPGLGRFSPRNRSSSQVNMLRRTSTPVQRVETPRTRAQRQRSESYQIKNIRWFDATSKQNPRESPILIQNANGPCPLLALVNALVLTTPSTENTALVEMLQTREQVSLGLLLDAVFDELMSSRRGEVAQDLPDVGDLYSFLVALHTGMNVNPRYVPSVAEHEPHHAQAFLSDVGEFEETLEMTLYSTFAIPLIHGWLPQRQSPAFLIFARTAPSYEEAANVLFREEELEAKLNAEGLSSDEETLREDIAVIKQFLASWPTQLTTYGLEAISRGLRPGQFTIFFRNDHFSTLYKEPKTGQLMTLVTDAGYASHEEIVWESLVDINGTHNELFAGDFQSVSHNTDVSTSSAPVGDGSGWTTVASRKSHQRSPSSPSSVPALPARPGVEKNKQTEGASNASARGQESSGSAYAMRATTEQEDLDLALALQLQEEEEERQRNERAARERENELSQQYLSQESSRTGPPMPPRPGAGGGEEVPPPTYEQAAAAQPFLPPRNHPSSPTAPLRPQTLYGQQASSYGGRGGAGPGRGRGRGQEFGTIPGRGQAPALAGRRKLSSRQSVNGQMNGSAVGASRRSTGEAGTGPATGAGTEVVEEGKEGKDDDRCSIM